MKPGNLQQLQGAKSGGVSDREMRNHLALCFVADALFLLLSIILSES